MTATQESTTRKTPDLFRVRPATPTQYGLFGLASLIGLDLMGLVPDGPAAGALVLTTAALLLLKQSVYRP
ncbi:hypothetical protein ACPCSC_30790 [Streptomyces lavendulocolor]|uniref:hypothetical protein n=1 Tax=Streptomyces lavendulocolor TaxID=67316 RepID=UPI003C2C533E